jgi:DNA-binding beta-propeller fold protein YncE
MRIRESKVTFEDFVHARSGSLLRTALLLTGQDRTDAEDLLQVALERAYRHWPRICRDEPERYVRKILVNASADRWRRLARRPEQPLPEASAGPFVPDRTSEIADRDYLLRAATDTIYVINSISSTLSVINGATCNARDAAGCVGAAATVHVGHGAIALDMDQATNTVYVANWDNGAGTTMSVINGRTCNGQITSGCSQPPAQVSVGHAPDGVFVDQATGTVYVATVSANGAAAVKVIDGTTCNSAATSGCGRAPASVSIGTESVNETVEFAIDHATATLYATNYARNTVSMINTARCNATVISGCAQTPPTVAVGRGPSGIAVNPATHTVYVSNATDNTVSVLDAATCNAATRSGCGKSWLLYTETDPAAVTIDQVTDTLYVPNADVFNESVFNGAICNATVTTGCAVLNR